MKIQRHIKTPIARYNEQVERFLHVNVDIVGPLPPSAGYNYLFTVVDCYTRWPEAIPMVDISAASCAQAFCLHWIGRFGAPQDITSDRGAQFTSELWHQVSVLLGSQLHLTSAYHPQANGMVERFHRHLKSSLMARCVGPDWINHLPWVLLGIRASIKEDLGFSSAELVYGADLRLPGEFVAPNHKAVAHSELVHQLHNTVCVFPSTPTSRPGSAPVYVPSALQT